MAEFICCPDSSFVCFALLCSALLCSAILSYTKLTVYSILCTRPSATRRGPQRFERCGPPAGFEASEASEANLLSQHCHPARHSDQLYSLRQEAMLSSVLSSPPTELSLLRSSRDPQFSTAVPGQQGSTGAAGLALSCARVSGEGCRMATLGRGQRTSDAVLGEQDFWPL